MKTELKGTQLEEATRDAMINFCPFGYLDIGTAVTVCHEVDEPTSYVYDCVSEFIESIDIKLEECDPVACVYDDILQHARNEIEDLTDFDFCNDGAEIYTAGNFMATSYDYQELDLLAEALEDVDEETLSIKTQWFLDQIEGL